MGLCNIAILYPWIPCEQCANFGPDIDVVDINRTSTIATRWYPLVWETTTEARKWTQKKFCLRLYCEVPSTCAMGLNIPRVKGHHNYQYHRLTAWIGACRKALLWLVGTLQCCRNHVQQMWLMPRAYRSMSSDKVSSKTHVLHFPPEKTIVHPRRRKWVVSLKLKLYVVYIVCSWEVKSRVSVIVVARVGKGTTTLHALTLWAGKM